MESLVELGKWLIVAIIATIVIGVTVFIWFAKKIFNSME
jgi:hypothetical protein